MGVNIRAGQSAGLAHYDPSQPQNGWNQHCAFGNGQVNTNGNNTVFIPGGGNGGTFTIYPGATLWFAPYTYPEHVGFTEPGAAGHGDRADAGTRARNADRYLRRFGDADVTDRSRVAVSPDRVDPVRFEPLGHDGGPSRLE